jgi:hypothetical protein
MGEKTSKALALELMDDLLHEDTKTAVHKGKDQANNDFAAAEEDPQFPSPVVEEEEEPGLDLSRPDYLHETEDAHRTEISGRTHVSEHAPATVPLAVNGEEDRTVRIQPSPVAEAIQVRTSSPPSAQPQAQAGSQGQASAPGKVRASVGRFGGVRAGGSANATEAALAQSESLRIAQGRMLELETEIERLRLQNEELAAAGETLRRRTDELTTSNQKRESDYQHAIATFRQEKEILISAKEAVQRDQVGLRQRNEELELRISSNIQKIRVRERELENRLELVKNESAALIRNKDETILEVKRQIDQLNLELNNYRGKNQELNRLTNDKQEMLRRTVKALRLALSMLEGEEEVAKAAPAPPARKAR